MTPLREAFARDFGVRGYADWRKLLAAEEIDLAYVFLPHDECPAAAVACAKRKRPRRGREAGGEHGRAVPPGGRGVPASTTSCSARPTSGAITRSAAR